MSSAMVTSLIPIHLRIFRLMSHTILTCNYMHAWYCFCFASRGHRVLFFGVPVLFLHSGREVLGDRCACLEVARVSKGGVFGFASVVVFWRKVNTLFQTLPQNVRSVQDFLHNIKNITKPQVRVRREGRRRDYGMRTRKRHGA
jgi:hypothetical protein